MRKSHMTEEDAAVVARTGWLSRQPEAFRAEVLRRSVAGAYEAGQVLYHLGDPPGGIYGLVSGVMMVTAAPGSALPRMIHVGAPGTWTGEGPYMIGGSRRIELRAAAPCRALHLPLEAMEQMTAADPQAARFFGQIPLINIDLLLRMVHDLLIKDVDRRIGAVLLRVTGGGMNLLPLSQDALGDMACATRKQANAALRRFAEAGWIVRGYRSVAIADAAGLRAFVAPADEG